MKKMYYLLLILLPFCACTTSYQIFDVDSTQVQEGSTEDSFRFENDSLLVVYDLWTDGGTLLYRVENKLDAPLEIALDKSYFGFQRDKINYYRPAARNEAALAPPNPDLAYSPYGFYDPLVVIPAGESRWLEGFPVTYDRLRLRKDKVARFTSTDSPVHFANYLATRWLDQENDKAYTTLTHEFWVTRVNEISKREWRELTDSDLAKTDKFYVSPAPEERPGAFWLQVGLGVLEEMMFMLTF